MSPMTMQAAVLLACLLVGHFLGDFTPLSTPRMLEAKARGGPLLPIAAHAAVHAVLTGAVVLVVVRPGLELAGLAVGIQFASHLALDGLRARLGVKIRSFGDPANNAFWTALGLDQLAHAVILVGIAALVL